jgi:mono/diheme cytochrome c family protein
MKNITIYLLFLLVFLSNCTNTTLSEKEINLNSYQIQAGFQLHPVASEPLLIAPMVIDFDYQGRIWVLELPGYMADINGKGEEDPTGRILILEDQNKNGRMDKTITFLDSLIAPRAMLLAYGGLLYAEPPKLWFVEIKNDQAGNKVLVDSSYVQVGNIEHQANALTMNIDNWIYSARSNARYQRQDGQWIKDQTIYRGQWGLTKDHLGRLFYNDKSNQFQGDFVLPKAAEHNKFLRPKHSLRQQIVTDQRIYPLHAPAINRGYIEGVLDEEGKPTHGTSSCGPVIYQGGLLGPDFDKNSFVCFPEGNLIKRNIINYDQEKISGVHALADKEFIASTDVAFRPVNLYNGPEGALYIVDLHKGVIQHRAYMSPYLRNLIEEQQLDTIVRMGRILKVLPQNHNKKDLPVLDENDILDLVGKLNHPNVWLRDKAQQLIVQNQIFDAVPLLDGKLKQPDFSIEQVHALWALEGLGRLSFPLLEKVIYKDQEVLSGLAFHLLGRLDNVDKNEITDLANHLFNLNNLKIDLYLASGYKPQVTSIESAFLFHQKLNKRYPDNYSFAELSFSALAGQEAAFIKSIEQKDTTAWTRIGYDLLTNIEEEKPNKELLPAENNPYGDKRQKGLELYRQYCAVCHSEDGHGMENAAPPLYDSDYVKGSTDRLAAILLHGLEGPIHIQGKRYEFNSVMPGIGHNPDLSNQDVLSIVTFLRNAFMTSEDFGGADLTEERIQELRSVKPKDGGLFTEGALDSLFNIND